MTDIARLISERARLWESHPVITESAILPTRPVQKADLRTDLVANQPVSPGWILSASSQARRTVAGAL